MRLTRDNYELIMFDLLEGNIPDEDKQSLYEQIEQDVFFAEEWRMFQATIIEPDLSIVFEKKGKLKHHTMRPPVMMWFSIGVAAVLIAGFMLFSLIGPDPTPSGVATSVPALTTPTAPSTPSDISTVKDDPQVEERILVKNNPSTTPKQIVVESTSPAEDQTTVPSIAVTDEMTTKPFEGTFASEQLMPPTSSTNDLDLPISDVTNTQFLRIRSVILASADNLRESKIKVNPNWKQKQLNIEFESKGYYAMASVGPFRN